MFENTVRAVGITGAFYIAIWFSTEPVMEKGLAIRDPDASASMGVLWITALLVPYYGLALCVEWLIANDMKEVSFRLKSEKYAAIQFAEFP